MDRQSARTQAGKKPASSIHWRWQRMRHVLRRVRGSLAQRGLRGTLRRIAGEWRKRPAADADLALVPLDEPFRPFALPVSDAPQVSVIIPVYGKLPHTLACLRSITRIGATAAFEVIVVDDASADASADTLREVDGLRLLCNASNLGFIGSCNAGAEAARGTYLLFLNNDTQVTPGWLDALLDCCLHEPDCGIAGSRLVYPDGRLQEAGGIVYADGSCWNVGCFEDRNDPRYTYRREVDYVSGAALMIPKRLFASIGGFNARYAPAYYEDTDLALSVQAAGRRVIYVPTSMVVHSEGITAGTDVFSGVKQQQQINQRRFAETWHDTLQKQPAPGTPVASILRGQRPRILVIDTTTPEPARDSASLRLWSIFQLLNGMGWQVIFLPDDGHADATQHAALGHMSVQVLRRPWIRDASAWLQREGQHLDAVMLCRRAMADQYLDLVRRTAPRALVMFDTVDLHFLREQRAAELSGNAALARQADTSRGRELALMGQSDVTFVVSPVERDLIAQEAPQVHVELLSNVHVVHGRHADFASRHDLVFIGGYNHPPNADAMRWMVRDILPRIRAREPDMVLHLLGDIPAHARPALTAPGVVLHGRVADLTQWMNGCRVSIAPLRYGAGVKGKVNMAMSHGLPVVGTPLAAEGMHLVDDQDILVVEDAQGFADAVLRLYHDEALWLRLSDAGLENVRRYFSPETARATLERVLQIQEG